MPTNDAELVKSIRSMLLNDHGDVPTVQLQRNNPVVRAAHSSNMPSSQAVVAERGKAIEGLSCNFEESSSSDEEFGEDEPSHHEHEKTIIARKDVNRESSAVSDTLMKDGSKESSDKERNEVVVVYEKATLSLDDSVSTSSSDASSTSTSDSDDS